MTTSWYNWLVFKSVSFKLSFLFIGTFWVNAGALLAHQGLRARSVVQKKNTDSP